LQYDYFSMLAFFRKRVHLMPKISKVKAWVIAQIEGVMKIEFRLGIRTSTRPDFIEGVRAVLIDKDQRPKWQPGSIEDVDTGDVKAVFAPFETPADELKIPDTVA
jgi:hypothetical protein